MRHDNCPGDECPRCAREIANAEYERECGFDDLPFHFDGT